MKTVLSASRRTDIPAFYMDWFMAGIEQGFFAVENPFSGQVSRVSARPGDVDTIVFWSKDYGPFLGAGFARKLQNKGFRLFFHFTINTTDRLLEPNVPPLPERLSQLAALVRVVPPAAVSWRFDPICFYETPDGGRHDNLGDFARIARAAAGCGVRRCVTSFMDHYPKIHRRLKALPGLRFTDPPQERRERVLQNMSAVLLPLDMKLTLCCERPLLDSQAVPIAASASACISHDLLTAIYGSTLSGLRDRGQRVSKGCGCQVSRDIGSYRHQPCRHSCLFCYANPLDRPAASH